MSGKFINTDRAGVLTQKSMSGSISKTVMSILNNPYYLLSDKKASECTYFNLNTTMTTMDEATRGNYGEISPESPLRFNKISNFFLYGVDKVQPNLEVGDYGLESSDISGDAIVLPYTLVPYPGDRFMLKIVKDPLIFVVTSVNPNTLETGAVMYRITYKLDTSDGMENIDSLIVKRLKFFLKNIGTNFGCFMDEETCDDMSAMENISTMLKDYYMGLFYDTKIQSFSYNYSDQNTMAGSLPNRFGYDRFWGFKVYDPYLIEFMIRNNLMAGSTKYLTLQQQMFLPVTFAIDYAKTFFSTLEENDINKHVGSYVGSLWLCKQELSLLYAFPIDYYYMDYSKLNRNLHYINIFDEPGFANHINANIKYENENKILYNILIMYLNNEEITIDVLEGLKHLDYNPTKDLFYLIPMVIYCIDSTISRKMSSAS